MDQPLISIIIPVYNTGKNAVKLIKNLLNDAYKNLEIIVVDDGSTDGSLAELQKLAKDSRLIVATKKNGGASSARNYGINISHGEYLIFIDSDDEVAKSFVTDLAEAISDQNVALAVTGMHFKKLQKSAENDAYLINIPKHKAESQKDYILKLFMVDGRIYSSVNKIFRANIIREHDIKFDEKLNFAEDTKFVLDYLKYADGEIKSILKPLYIYNFGTETSTVKKSSTIWKNWENSFNDLKKWVGKNPTVHQKCILSAIFLRWRASYHRSCYRAKLAG